MPQSMATVNERSLAQGAHGLGGKVTPQPHPGSRSAGAWMLLYANHLAHSQASEDDLIDISQDRKEPHLKRAAARWLLAAGESGWYRGKMLALDPLTRLLEHTHGKATQRVEVTRREAGPPEAVVSELRRILNENPRLRLILNAALPLIDGEAVGEGTTQPIGADSDGIGTEFAGGSQVSEH